MSAIQKYHSVPDIARAMLGHEGMLVEIHIRGKWYRVRRNGVVQSWKRDPHRYRLPFKHGFRGYGFVSSSTLHNNTVQTMCWINGKPYGVSGHVTVDMRYGWADNWTTIPAWDCIHKSPWSRT